LVLESVGLTLTGAFFYNAPKVSSDQINVNGSGSLIVNDLKVSGIGQLLV
jgi:hypothetical protein